MFLVTKLTLSRGNFVVEMLRGQGEVLCRENGRAPGEFRDFAFDVRIRIGDGEVRVFGAVDGVRDLLSRHGPN